MIHSRRENLKREGLVLEEGREENSPESVYRVLKEVILKFDPGGSNWLANEGTLENVN